MPILSQLSPRPTPESILQYISTRNTELSKTIVTLSKAKRSPKSKDDNKPIRLTPEAIAILKSLNILPS